MRIHNNNCDGDHCREAHGEVRVYPLGAPGTMSGNLILCRACWVHENRYRHERQVAYMRGSKNRVDDQRRAEENWPQHDWYNAKRYPEE